MAGILKRKPLLDGRHADNLGYVNSVDEAYDLIAEFEIGLTTKFSCFKADIGVGNTGMYICIDRTAEEKRKRKDAEEILYIIFSFYPRPLCHYCHL